MVGAPAAVFAVWLLQSNDRPTPGAVGEHTRNLDDGRRDSILTGPAVAPAPALAAVTRVSVAGRLRLILRAQAYASHERLILLDESQQTPSSDGRVLTRAPPKEPEPMTRTERRDDSCGRFPRWDREPRVMNWLR
jgi:hypothetical protein